VSLLKLYKEFIKSITKKITVVSLRIIILVAGLAWWYLTKELNKNISCAFLQSRSNKTHMFYEDEFVWGLCSYKPVQP